jgi:hypothetical protein
MDQAEDVLPLLESSGMELSPGEAPKERNNLGVLNGVFVPCMLNIVGAILFLRLSWAVGQAGFLGTVSLLFCLQLKECC